MSPRRLVLVATLVVATAALAYNAFSIIQGQSGLLELSGQLLPR
jgi:hypothetical protein